MITEPTLFILGAGASAPYGYPTGKELRRMICKEFPQSYLRLVAVGFGSDVKRRREAKKIEAGAKNLAETFFRSSTPSIDLFLARNPQYAEIGKAAIAHHILEAESRSSFREDMDAEEDWYSYLFDRMTRSLKGPKSYESFSQNRVAFITFNYDRSLEYFLHDSLVNSFTEIKLNKIPVLSLIQFPIIHIYGKIADLQWENDKGLQYKTRLNYGVIETIHNNIRIVGELSSADVQNKIQDVMIPAKRIFFLGFGFAEENLEILQVTKFLNGSKQIYGTTRGLREKERRQISHILGANFKREERSELNPLLVSENCYELLRRYL